jgi:tetratricopeptide (TPR) repeat protein
MRKWIITAVVVGVLATLGATARLWLPQSLAFLGANSTVIQTLSSLGQLMLWGGAVIALVIRLWQSKPKATQQPEVKPPEDNKGKTPHRPRAVVSALNQLPAPPRDFTGRKEELDELTREIERGGATISGLQGQGGVGKTTLALKLAEQLADRFTDAQFYLDLKGTTQPLTPSDAMAHVIRAYHPTAKLPDKEDELRALYNSVLHNQRALLLMDNARDAEQVEPLIPPDSCVLLVTSRWHFYVPGLFAKDLDTLPPEDARALLTRIAPRINDHAEEIARLCGRLPLALRLAASAVAERRDLSPADYVRRLSDEQQRLKLLDKVEVSLSLSYDLLTPDLQKLWRALAVFPATFDAQAAAAVWNIEQDAAHDALGELVKYSLLDWDDTIARYSLHDLARLLAGNRLSDEERYAAQARHAEHYLNVLAEADDLYLQGGEAFMRGLALFDAEWANIQTGQSWAVHHDGDDETIAQLCSTYPNVGWALLYLRQPLRERAGWLEKSLLVSRRLSDRTLEAVTLINLSLAYIDLNEPLRAIECAEQALPITQEFGHLFAESCALGNLGIAYGSMGEPHRAVEFLEQQLNIVREIGDRRGESHALGNLGNAYFVLGETRRAVEFYEQRLAIAREIGDRRGEGNALWNMSLALDALGERNQAIVHAEAALGIYEQIEDPNAARVRKKLAEWRGQAE